jgi:hypothetical protein
MKLFIRSSLFLLIGLFLLQLLAYIVREKAPDGTSMFLHLDQEHVRQVLDNSSTVESIVLGSSHGDDIDFSSTRFHGYSLARAWGDFFETEYYLKYLVPRLPELKVVFIPVGYFSFDWDNAQIDELAVRREQVYTTIPSWSIIPGDFKDFFIGRGAQLVPIKTILRQDNWKGIFFSLIKAQDTNSSNSTPTEDCKYVEISQLAVQADARADEQIQFAKEARLSRPTIREDSYQAVVATIQYLLAHNIRVVFFTPPYYSEYTNHYRQNDFESIAAMQEMMKRLQRDFGIIYFDFSTDVRFVSDNKLFTDSDHLNLCGKQMFSKILDQALAADTQK